MNKPTKTITKLKTYPVYAFDLDGTIAQSKEPIEPAMAKALISLLGSKKVLIITGGKFDLIKTQVLDVILPLFKDAKKKEKALNNLSLLPVSGTQYYHYQNGEFVGVYNYSLTADQKFAAVEAVMDEATEMGLLKLKREGDLIEDRGGQITFSALGQKAKIARKLKFDPERKIRDDLARRVQRRLPDLEVHPGGSTSIDITRIGVNKAFGIKRVAALLNIDLKKIFYYGDKFGETGNDRPVADLGIAYLEVKNPQNTLKDLHLRTGV